MFLLKLEYKGSRDLPSSVTSAMTLKSHVKPVPRNVYSKTPSALCPHGQGIGSDLVFSPIMARAEPPGASLLYWKGYFYNTHLTLILPLPVIFLPPHYLCENTKSQATAPLQLTSADLHMALSSHSPFPRHTSQPPVAVPPIIFALALAWKFFSLVSQIPQRMNQNKKWTSLHGCSYQMS